MIATLDVMGLLTRSQAAHATGLCGETISKAMAAGKLPFVETPHGRLIDPHDLAAWRQAVEARRYGRRDQ